MSKPLSSRARFRLSVSAVWFLLALLSAGRVCRAQEGNGNVTGDPLAQPVRAKSATPVIENDRVTAVPEDFAKVKLAPGDLLRFGVYDEPQMSATLRVSADGNIQVPLAGALSVAGNSLSEARTKIRAALISGEYFKDPEVSLDIAQLAPGRITILGEVQSPGRYELLAPTTLEAALGLAGGETVNAGSEIEIHRPATGSEEKITDRVSNEKSVGENGFDKVTVEPGDTITVPRAGIVYVLGSVHRPGGYIMLNRGRLNLLQALSLAGGTSLEASTGSIRIFHRDDRQATEMTVKLSDYTHGRSTAPFLGDKDIVYVPSNKAKSIAVNGAVIIGATTSSLVYRVP